MGGHRALSNHRARPINASGIFGVFRLSNRWVGEDINACAGAELSGANRRWVSLMSHSDEMG